MWNRWPGKLSCLFTVVKMVIISVRSSVQQYPIAKLNISAERNSGNHCLLLPFLLSPFLTIFCVLIRRFYFWFIDPGHMLWCGNAFFFLFALFLKITCNFWWSPAWEEMLLLGSVGRIRPGFFHMIMCSGPKSRLRRVWKDFFSPVFSGLYSFKKNFHESIKSSWITHLKDYLMWKQ